jgi:hypothetical protein
MRSDDIALIAALTTCRHRQIGLIVVYERADARIKVAHHALQEMFADRYPMGFCSDSYDDTPEWREWIAARIAHGEARRNLPMDAEDICDRPCVSGPSTWRDVSPGLDQE